MPQLVDFVAVEGYSLWARRLLALYSNASWFKFQNSLQPFERR